MTPVNDLIAVTLGQNKLIRLYIQFIADVNSPRDLKNDARILHDRILTEVNNKAFCLGYAIRFDLMPTFGLPQGAIDKNFLAERDATVRNPFQPFSTGVVPPVDPPFQEEDKFGNPVTSSPTPPTLPLIRFYIGDGESLTTTIVGEGNDPIIDEQTALGMRNHNLTHGFDGVIPGYEFEYSTKTSFFSRELRVGYLFETPDIQVTFMHELGHVLGLSDRYIEGIDDASPNHPSKYVGKAARGMPPLSVDHINSVLAGSPGSPESDYNPQDNLMSSRSYRLSSYQKYIIDNQRKETTYVSKDVMVLLFRNPACKRVAHQYSGLSCLTTETPYHPTSVSVNPGTHLPQVTFQSSSTTPPVLHNAVFKGGAAVVPVRFQSEKANKQILKAWMSEDGLHSEVVEMILRYFEYKP
jgi:hypothetical protein